MSSYRLANEHLALEVGTDGTLQALIDQKRGHNLVGAPGRSLWKLVFRDAVSLENAIRSEGQRPRIEQTGDRLTIDYDELEVGGAPLPIRLSLSLRLVGDEIHAQSLIVNQSDTTVSELWFPLLDGIQSVARDPAQDVLLLPQNNGRRIAHPLATFGPDISNTGYCGSARQVTLLYPGPAALPWLALGCAEATLYLASTDRHLDTTALTVQRHLHPACLSLGIVRFPEARPGETVQSEPLVISLHQGDWHTSARKYRAWLDTWLRWAEPPAWVAEMPAWQLTIMRAQYGGVTWDYAGLAEMWQGAKSAGVDTLFLFAWWDAGHDNRYPEPYLPSELMGGESLLRRQLDMIEREGGHAILYTQGRLIDPATEFYRREGAQMAVKSIWGTEYREQYNFWYESAALAACSGKAFVMACPAHVRWQEVLLAQGRAVQQLGAGGVLYDQIGGSCQPYLCYDPTHPHDRPANGFAAPMLRNVWAVREDLKSRDREFAFVTENLSDVLCSGFDIIHGGGFGCRAGPQSYPSLFRYTLPEVIVTNRMVGVDELPDLAFGFLHGYRFDLEPLGARGHLGQTPQLAGRARQLCDLRRRYAPSLLRGRYVDDQGIALDQKQDCLAAKAFVGDGQAAVVVWNLGTQPVTARPNFEGRAPHLGSIIDPAPGSPSAIAPGGLALFVYE